jgi:hypothetical protein
MNKMNKRRSHVSGPKGETVMKEDIFDNIVRFLVLAGLTLFGLRGVLPDIAGIEQLSVALGSGAAVILAFGIVRYAYRCSRCAPTCNLKVCRAM